MKKIDIDELKRIQLDILDDIHQFCLKNNIRYSLSGGTLIGAVRHKGYIPWDDDIDIMMPRPDYDRFLQTFISSKNEVVDLSKIDSCEEMFAKVYRKGTSMYDSVFRRNLFGVNVDVFPIEGVPDVNPEKHVVSVLGRRELLPKICPFYRTATKNKFLLHCRYLLKRIVYFYPHNLMYVKREIDGLIRKYDFSQGKFAGALLGSYGLKEIVPKTTFDEYICMAFEGKEYMVIKDYDVYLTSLFSDYMSLPPIDKRVSNHSYEAYYNNSLVSLKNG